jgi:hypothetical protein
MTKQEQRAFTLGFLSSREGFNGECAYDHCAPNKIDDHDLWTDLPEAEHVMERMPEFRRLRLQAGAKLSET